ncbi:MAG: ATP-binding protein [Ignavibacteriales bacterium]
MNISKRAKVATIGKRKIMIFIKQKPHILLQTALARYKTIERTEIWSGLETISKKSFEVLSRAKSTSDYCHDSKSPPYLVTNDQYFQMIKQLKVKGIRQRFVTEITQENVRYSQELANHVELRHLEGVKGNFGIVDGREYGAAANIYDPQPPVEFIYSNVKSFVDQQQYFFETLWNKAIPAEKKIREIEEGIPAEVTEIWYGADNIVKKQLQIITEAQATVDYCHSSESPSIIATFKPFMQTITQLNKRGVKQRYITEITEGNVRYCKELAKYVELRHLDRVQGTLGIIDSKIYGAIANTKENHLPTEFIYSNVKSFIDQQQYFFETLWNKAIPAELRIKEIEEGRAPEKLEIIQDTQKSISHAFDIMNKTQKELLVLFATERTFSFALQGEAADLYRRISENGVDIKLLVPRGRGAAEIEENNEQIAKVREEISPSISLKLSDVDLNTRITIMISDRNEFMSWELKDDTLDDPYLAGGIATYSNIKSLASSYATIFDNLWKITELAENLRIANIKLESNEKAMKEFINIAAHELRTPIQPILGLSEMLNYDSSTDPQQHRKLVDVIVRNAHKLENLAEDILDVTRIESGHLQLSMEKVDLYELVESVVHDFQRFLPAGGKITINFQKLSDDRHDDHDHHGISHLPVLGDPRRIAQVLSNLLKNALKFTKEGTISVRVGKNDSSSYSEAVVSISDSGQGIDPEVIYKLFEKFVSKSERGTGLGLFISKSIVEAHGGKIWGENNEDGKGATFTFRLPLIR